MAEMKKVDFKLTREGLVKLEHKETDGTFECLPESLPVWLDAGWTVVNSDPADERPVVVTVDEEKQTGSAAPAPKEK